MGTGKGERNGSESQRKRGHCMYHSLPLFSSFPSLSLSLISFPSPFALLSSTFFKISFSFTHSLILSLTSVQALSRMPFLCTRCIHTRTVTMSSSSTCTRAPSRISRYARVWLLCGGRGIKKKCKNLSPHTHFLVAYASKNASFFNHSIFPY